MSDLILPPGITLPTASEDESPGNKAKQLPDPVGYKLLCVVPDVSTTFDGSSLIKADMSMRSEEHATTVLFVLKVGADAYKDTAKFPSGAWCKAGDFVLVRTYSGTRFKIHGKEFRMINDDQVEGTVEDPRGVTRVAV